MVLQKTQSELRVTRKMQAPFTCSCRDLISSSMMARHLVKSVRSWSAVGISLQPCAREAKKKKKKLDRQALNIIRWMYTQTDSKTKGNSLRR